jgi:hypothetical protein
MKKVKKILAFIIWELGDLAQVGICILSEEATGEWGKPG